MTGEQLKIANKKMEQIQELENFIEAFEYPAMNCIAATAFGADSKECRQTMIIHSDSELHNLILNYFNSELERLKKEFQNL